jgi:hypothetical protein
MLRWRRQERRERRSEVEETGEERGERREEKWAVSLQLAWAQESRNSVRETSGPCINSEELTTI